MHKKSDHSKHKQRRRNSSNSNSCTEKEYTESTSEKDQDKTTTPSKMIGGTYYSSSTTSSLNSNSSSQLAVSVPVTTITNTHLKSTKPRKISSRIHDNNQDRILPEDVGDYDVLCGRDKSVFNHVGNRRFRVSLALWIPRYEEAETKSQKAAIIGALCNMLQNEARVRFLKRQEEEGQDGDKIVYYVKLNSTQTKKKVGHAIRDMSVARKEVTQRRESLKKAKKDAKKTGGSGHDGDDDTSTEDNLNESLTAMLPFVDNSFDDGAESSFEPLPFGQHHDRQDAATMDQKQPSTTPHAVASMPAPAAGLDPSFHATHLNARPPTMQHQPPYFTHHYHYHYVQPSLDARSAMAMSLSNSLMGGQQQQQQRHLSQNFGQGQSALYNHENKQRPSQPKDHKEEEHQQEQQQADMKR
jgi:hypothetical protein